MLACVVGLATLALAWTLPADAWGLGVSAESPFEAASTEQLAGEASRDTSVTIGLQVARADAGRPTLNLRGNSVGPQQPDAFDVDTHIWQIPCPGEYLFHAAEEDSSNGNSSSYSALIKLFNPSAHPPGARCGGPPPPFPGHMSVLLQDQADRLFVVKGNRSNAGAFEGGLTLSHLPECGKSYVLEAALDLAGWSRSVEFKLRAIKIDVTLQGKAIESERC